MVNHRSDEQQHRKEEQKYVNDTKSPVGKPEKCPKCGAAKITSCPGGTSLKAVPGIWWICDECKHQW
jgi:hypothetical protein